MATQTKQQTDPFDFTHPVSADSQARFARVDARRAAAREAIREDVDAHGSPEFSSQCWICGERFIEDEFEANQVEIIRIIEEEFSTDLPSHSYCLAGRMEEIGCN